MSRRSQSRSPEPEPPPHRRGPLLICDLDGTLVDSFGDIRAGVSAALRAIDRSPDDDILALCGRGIGLELFYTRATGQRADGDEFARFVTVYRDSYPGQGRAYRGVAATLRALRREFRDLRCAVATAKRTEVARKVVESCALAEYFDVVRGSDGLPAKPDPAILRDVAACLGRPVEGAIVVGDTDRDVLAARAAGCVAVAVTYGGWTRAELEALAPREPDHLIDGFEALIAIASEHWSAERPG
jgi:phosphoglycolate phosphatase